MDLKSLMERIDELQKQDSVVAEGEKKETKTGIVHKGTYGNEYTGDGDDDDEETKKDKKAKKKEISQKRGRGRPKKDADARTGEKSTFDTSALSGIFGGKKPKKEIGKVSAKNKLKEYMERVESNKQQLDEFTAPANTVPVMTKDSSGKQGVTFIDSTNPALKAALQAASKKPGELTGMMAPQANTASTQTSTTQPTKSVSTTQSTANQPQVQAVAEEEMMEVSPPGMEDWVEKHKPAFKKEYGDKKGTAVAFATAWKEYNKKHGKKTESMMESIEMESKLDKVLRRFPHEHKQCQEGYGMDEGLYEALCDHYFEEGRIPKHLLVHAPIHELREFVEECYGRDTGLLMDEAVDSMAAQHYTPETAPTALGKVGQALKSGAGKVLNTLGHGSDEDLLHGLRKDVYDTHGSNRYNEDALEEESNLERSLRATAMHDEEAKLGEMMYESKKLDEKFDKEAKLNPAKKGMFNGKNKAELQKEKAALKKSGPHKRGSKEDTKMKELNFAIRAKSGWGKTDESIEESQDMEESALQAYLGDKKYGEKGMDELRDLGRKHVGKKKMDAAKARLAKHPKNEDAQMESWERQLNSMLTEGQSVSISLGQENMPDSVTVTANDDDAHALIKLLQNAGMGGVVGAAKNMANAADAEGGMSSLMSVNSDDEPEAGEIEVVDFDSAQDGLEGPGEDDGGDSALSFLKKMLGQVQGAEHSGADAEMLHPHDDEEECSDCGHSPCDCDDEEGEVCSDCGHSPCDCEEEEMDEGAGIMHYKKEQAQKAGKDHFELGGKEYPVKEESESEEDDHAERAGKRVAKDIEHDEGDDSKEDDKAERAGKRVTKDIEYDDKQDKQKKKMKEDESDMAAAVVQSANDKAAAETEKETAMAEGEEMCNECGGYMEEGHTCSSHEKLDEWANNPQMKDPELERFYATVKFMTNDISGGLNGQKVDDTTLPHTRVRSEPTGGDEVNFGDLKKLAGLR